MSERDVPRVAYSLGQVRSLMAFAVGAMALAGAALYAEGQPAEAAEALYSAAYVAFLAAVLEIGIPVVIAVKEWLRERNRGDADV